jgi:hypothetical protein
MDIISVTLWIGGRVGPIICLDSMEKRTNIFTLSGIESGLTDRILIAIPTELSRIMVKLITNKIK